MCCKGRELAAVQLDRLQNTVRFGRSDFLHFMRFIIVEAINCNMMNSPFLYSIFSCPFQAHVSFSLSLRKVLHGLFWCLGPWDKGGIVSADQESNFLALSNFHSSGITNRLRWNWDFGCKMTRHRKGSQSWSLNISAARWHAIVRDPNLESSIFQ